MSILDMIPAGVAYALDRAMRKNPEDLTDVMLDTHRKMPNPFIRPSPVRQARYLADANGVATDIPNPDYVAVER